jgi:perosamine synthetase
MQNFIPLASPDIKESDIDYVVEVLRSGNLVQGKYVEQIESQLCQNFNYVNSILVSNGTATLHLILVALGIGTDDEVIVPAFSYIATANVVELVGAKPVFVDINEATFNIDPSLIEKKITSKTKALIAVHEFGLAADVTFLKDLCNQYGIFLIEDAACALGAKENNEFVGKFGIASSFSFHPRKAITSGEGGVVVTNDKILASKIRTLRNHGIDSDKRNFNDFIMAGFNYRMTDFQAALLKGQIERFSFILNRKQFIARRYLDEIDNSKLKCPYVPEGKIHTWQTFYLLVNDDLNRDDLILKLKNEGIGSNYGAQCIPAQTFYKNKYRFNVKQEFPSALKAYEKGIAIPIYEKMTDEQVSYIIERINLI